MKYRRLTKEQLEELHREFINFLATQSITAAEWEQIKSDSPAAAEEEIDIFSDLIWEGVLRKVEYLENISADQMHLFRMTDKDMKLIAIRVHNPDVDLMTTGGFEWFKKHFMTDMVDIMTATKTYSADRNKDKFELIEKGAVITKGKLYHWFEEMMMGDE
ncbi:DUF6495 family protein [Sinomicrobium oceani]|uniref:DUF6495 family protein n=1 Tax=Sinomicrobium oceani TaxID=1150368 RepID=UPI00227C4F95|nr:DUF6495 family protein [Sinomicrobium oceani]